jgi:primase-polymerase (primpol)-like protein
VPIYLPPDASPRTTADELDVLRLALPEWLCLGERWAAWRYEWDPHRDDWGKVPLDALSLGRYARSTDPRTCTSLAHAVAFRRRYGADGLLRLLVEGEEVLAIDLDHVRSAETGELSPLARDTLARVPGYAEVSPSACGLHLYLREPFPEPGRQGRKQGQVEIYSGSRFVTVTGRVVRRGR